MRPSFSLANLTRTILLAAVVIPLGMMIPRHLTISVSPSLQHHLFWLDNNPGRITAGAYVRFPRADQITRGETVMFLKRVECDEGEQLSVDESKTYFCSGRYLGRAKDRSRAGEAVRHFYFNGVVPAGKMFVMGDHIDSYDSRYIGFVDKAEVVGRAWPIF